MATTYAPVQRSWSASDLLAKVERGDVTCSRTLAAQHEPRLWTDLAAEYDARLLQAEVLGRGTEYSAEFHAFLRAWAEDETNHTEGLLRLYSLVMDVPESHIRLRLAQRTGDFAPIARWLGDEFELTVLLAYDEAMSTLGYSEDIPFYASLGPPEFGALLRELKNDEAVHYRNALELLVHRYSDRADEIPEVMDEIVAFDVAQREYRATFLLDHATAQFTPELMRRVGHSVSGVLVRHMRRSLARRRAAQPS